MRYDSEKGYLSRYCVFYMHLVYYFVAAFCYGRNGRFYVSCPMPWQ